MKILWLCNIILPRIAQEVNLPIPTGGSWLSGMLNGITRKGIDLTVISLGNQEAAGVVSGEGGFNFRILKQKNLVNQFKDILKGTSPDVIHIFGTEFSHSLKMVQACEILGLQNRICINLQGIISTIALKEHFFSGLRWWAFVSITLRGVLLRDSVRGLQKKYSKRGRVEVETLRRIKHVIGRTDWDRACSLRINPFLKYHFCNETLREPFYNDEGWKLEECEKYSIFFTQCRYPIKGFHFLLEALPEIKKKFPQTRVYVTGRDILRPKNTKEWLLRTDYQKYLCKLIKKHSLEGSVFFCGSLDEQAMKNRFKKSHVFVSASTVENESNSISEAKILGVPVISSFVSGVSKRIRHGIDGFFYPQTSVYMLAYYISEIFSDDCLAKRFSDQGKAYIRSIVDPELNSQKMLKIYSEIGDEN